MNPRLLRISSASAASVTAAQAAAWAASRRAGRTNVADVAWGPGLAATATVSALLAGSGRRRRALMLASAVSGWGARLAVHVHHASAGRGEDPRYAEMLDGSGPIARVVKVFVTQGVAQWVVSCPLLVAAASGSTPRRPAERALAAVGWGMLVAGGALEALADRQKSRWRSDPDHGPVMDRGVWAWSRHPNYFGDACFWWGVYMVCAASGPARWTIWSPALMSWTLVEGTGARRAERMRADDPDYAAYQRRVSFFLPRPPRTDLTSRSAS